MAKALDLAILQKTSTHHQADESVRVEVTFSSSQWKTVQEMQRIHSHSVKSQDFAEMVIYLAEKIIQKKNGKPKAKASVQSMGSASNGSSSSQRDLSGPSSSVSDPRSCSNVSRNENKSSCAKAKFSATTQESAVSVCVQVAESTSAVEVAKTMNEKKTKAQRKAIPSFLQREVFAKYPSCQYRDPQSGKVCGERHYLQMEHRKPLWAGGDDRIENLTALCGNHNRYQYRQQSGMRKDL